MKSLSKIGQMFGFVAFAFASASASAAPVASVAFDVDYSGCSGFCDGFKPFSSKVVYELSGKPFLLTSGFIELNTYFGESLMAYRGGSVKSIKVDGVNLKSYQHNAEFLMNKYVTDDTFFPGGEKGSSLQRAEIYSTGLLNLAGGVAAEWNINLTTKPNQQFPRLTDSYDFTFQDLALAAKPGLLFDVQGGFLQVAPVETKESRFFGSARISDFTVSAVPEPESYAMLLGGLGLLYRRIKTHRKNANMSA